MSISKAIFLIESGKPLEMVLKHIADISSVTISARMLIKELGCERYQTSQSSGRIMSVMFPKEVHPDFKKPDRKGYTYPRKNTDWYKIFSAQPALKLESAEIQREFSIPNVLNYSSGLGVTGTRRLGYPLNECGFLYMPDGPYALWATDVPAEVAATIANGYTVDEPVNSFQFNIPGARRILAEEWKLLVAQQELKLKLAQ